MTEGRLDSTGGIISDMHDVRNTVQEILEDSGALIACVSFFPTAATLLEGGCFGALDSVRLEAMTVVSG